MIGKREERREGSKRGSGRMWRGWGRKREIGRRERACEREREGKEHVSEKEGMKIKE